MNFTTYKEIYYHDKKVKSVYHTSQKPKLSAKGGTRQGVLDIRLDTDLQPNIYTPRKAVDIPDKF